MGALYEDLPPEFEGLAESIRVRITETFMEAHKAGMSDMADALSQTFSDIGLEGFAVVIQNVKAIGIAEVDRIAAERRG